MHQVFERFPGLSVIVLLFLSVLWGCSGCPGTEPDLPLACEAQGFPCSLAEVDDSVLERSMEIGEEAMAMMLAGEDREAVVDFLSGVDSMAEIRAGQDSLFFRLEGGRNTWVAYPWSPLFASPNEALAVSASQLAEGSYEAPRTQTQELQIASEQEVVHREGVDRHQKRALVLAPYTSERGAEDTAVAAMRNLSITRGYRGQARFVTQVTVNDLTSWADYDVVHLSTHGDIVCLNDEGVVTRRFGSDERQDPSVELPSDPTLNCSSFVGLGISLSTGDEFERNWTGHYWPPGDNNGTPLHLSEVDGDDTLTFRAQHVGVYEIKVGDTDADCNLRTAVFEVLAHPEQTSELETTFLVGEVITIVEDTPPVDPNSAALRDYYNEMGLDLLLRPPTKVESTSAQESHSDCDFAENRRCPTHWNVVAGTDFFAKHYGPGNPLQNTLLFFAGCKTMLAPDLAEVLWGPSNAFLGWDNLSRPSEAFAAAKPLYENLRNGMTISQAIEEIGDKRTQDFPMECGPDLQRTATLRGKAGRDLRIREVLTPYEYESDWELSRLYPMSRLVSLNSEDRSKDQVRMSVLVEGLTGEDSLGGYELRVFIDDNEVEESWRLDGDHIRRVDENSLFVDLEATIGKRYDELPDPVDIRLELELPDGDGRSEIEFQGVTAPCFWQAELTGDINRKFIGTSIGYERSDDGEIAINLVRTPSLTAPTQNAMMSFETTIAAPGRGVYPGKGFIVPDVHIDRVYVSDQETFNTPLLTFQVVEETTTMVGRVSGTMFHFDDNGNFAGYLHADVVFHGVEAARIDECAQPVHPF